MSKKNRIKSIKAANSLKTVANYGAYTRQREELEGRDVAMDLGNELLGITEGSMLYAVLGESVEIGMHLEATDTPLRLKLGWEEFVGYFEETGPAVPEIVESGREVRGLQTVGADEVDKFLSPLADKTIRELAELFASSVDRESDEFKQRTVYGLIRYMGLTTAMLMPWEFVSDQLHESVWTDFVRMMNRPEFTTLGCPECGPRCAGCGALLTAEDLLQA